MNQKKLRHKKISIYHSKTLFAGKICKPVTWKKFLG